MFEWRKHITIIFSTFLLIASGFVLGTSTTQLQAVSPNAQTDLTELSETERIFSDIYLRVSPAVVSITTDLQRTDGTFTPLSSGSGFVIDLDGHIVTNFHVIEDADRIVVNMFDGTIIRATPIGADPSSDLAVIRVDLAPDRLAPVPLGDSNALVVGQTVLAIGNPFSRDWTLTSGIVSALNRTIVGLDSQRSSIGGVIQTDTAINPGNSGGPLLNLRGEVVGVNSQIEVQSGVRISGGVGYAIPSNLVRRVATELIADHEVNYSYLGIFGRSIDIDLIDIYSLPNNLRGVAVTQVASGGPSSRSGLHTITRDSVDVITAINGTGIANFEQLVSYLAVNTVPGQEVTLSVYRQGQTLQIPVTLGIRP